MKLKKIPKKLWHDGVLWDVHSVISPNAFDDYIVLSRLSKHSVHQDGETTPVEMVLIDAHNDPFYPDNPVIRKVMNQRQVESTRKDRERKILTDAWLSFFRR